MLLTATWPVGPCCRVWRCGLGHAQDLTRQRADIARQFSAVPCCRGPGWRLPCRREVAMRKAIAMADVPLDGMVQAPGHPDQDTRGGFAHGGWALPTTAEACRRTGRGCRPG